MKALSSLVFSLMALVALPAMGDVPEGAPPQTQAPGRQHRGLDLSPEQRNRLQAIRSRHREQLRTSRQATRQARQAFFEALRDPAAKVDQLRQLHRALSDQMLENLLARRAMRLEMREVLTPEQRERVSRRLGRGAGPKRWMRGW